MKPYGLSWRAGRNGPLPRVRRPTQVEDAIWDAVERAIEYGWSPERFRNEAAEAWKDRLARDAENAAKELTR